MTLNSLDASAKATAMAEAADGAYVTTVKLAVLIGRLGACCITTSTDGHDRGVTACSHRKRGRIPTPAGLRVQSVVQVVQVRGYAQKQNAQLQAQSMKFACERVYSIRSSKLIPPHFHHVSCAHRTLTLHTRLNGQDCLERCGIHA